jgi:septal ring factor EnvC (AmiA/AmiB activator)
MFSQNSKVAVLESKLDMYEDLSREMLAKLESAVEKISEGNNRIAQILTKHDERIEQSMKTDDLIIKMIDEVKSESEKDHKVIHERIDKIEQNINALSKFKWQAGAAAAVLALLVGAGSRIVPFFLTPPTQPVIIENQK